MRFPILVLLPALLRACAVSATTLNDARHAAQDISDSELETESDGLISHKESALKLEGKEYQIKDAAKRARNVALGTTLLKLERLRKAEPLKEMENKILEQRKELREGRAVRHAIEGKLAAEDREDMRRMVNGADGDITSNFLNDDAAKERQAKSQVNDGINEKDAKKRRADEQRDDPFGKN